MVLHVESQQMSSLKVAMHTLIQTVVANVRDTIVHIIVYLLVIATGEGRRM